MIASSCQPSQPACPPGSITYLKDSELETIAELLDASSNAPNQEQVLINGKMMMVDKVVRGSLCSDTWRGTVYVPCQIKIFEWEDEADFLKDCDLSIEPGTVVYVAAHNDAPYYQGCACHTSENSQ